jgi:hypothetical protein
VPELGIGKHPLATERPKLRQLLSHVKMCTSCARLMFTDSE